MTEVAEQAEQTERVSMVWPKELKDRVRDKVGARGLTEFVVEAVDLHLQGSAEVLHSAGKEVNDLKWLVQQLADRVAIGGDSDTRLQGLMELELPEWLDTAGWPAEAASRVRPKPVAPEPVPEPEPDPEPVAVAEAKVEEPVPATSPYLEAVASEVKSVGDEMLAKVMAKAKEKGVDLADIGLKPASEVEAPEKPEPYPEIPPGTVEATVEAEVILQEQGMTVDEFVEHLDEIRKCPTCGEELIDGECWTCM